jgi:hypothetical protein
MIKKRPKLRFDGIYVCKLKYYRAGEAIGIEYAPIVEVITYKYMRLKRNGVAQQCYTVKPPAQFFEAVKNAFLKKGSSGVSVSEGYWQMHNNEFAVTMHDRDQEYRYEFVAHRACISEKAENVELVWQGLRDTDGEISTNHADYTTMKFKSMMPPRFRF